MEADPKRATLQFISALALLVMGLSACSEAKKDPTTAVGKQAIMDKVNSALTVGDCRTALAEIGPLYNSANSDNDVRMLAASVYGCYAGVNLFGLIGNLGANSSLLSGGGFWGLLSKLFPSDPNNPDDRVVESAELATDALFSVLKTGEVIPQTVVTAPTGFNPGSMVYSDRLDQANTYLVFISMAQIGSIQNRFGAPNQTDFKKTKNLPWNTALALDDNGCAYASAMVNFVDALASTAASSTGSLKDSLTKLQTTFATVIFGACRTGCANAAGPYIPGHDNADGTPNFVPGIAAPTGFTQSGCTVTTDCAQCPIALRDRTKCKALTNDQTSCAAAGIVNFINTMPTVGWDTH